MSNTHRAEAHESERSAEEDVRCLLEAYRYGQFSDDMLDHPSPSCRSPAKPVREALRRFLDRLEAARATPPTEPVAAHTSERRFALREAHENAAERDYFDARPQIDTDDRRNVFKHGFDRGFDAGEKVYLSARIAALQAAAVPTWRDVRGLCMRAAEGGYKAGAGRDRAVRADLLRPIVDEVLGAGVVAESEAAVPTSAAVPVEVVQAENERLRVALRFYARGEHYVTDESEDFDTCSGEPQNWLFSGLEDSTTSIETGSIARAALRGEPIVWDSDGEDDTPQPIEGERATLQAAEPAAKKEPQ